MHDVDDVAVGDVAGLGALERAALLIEQEAQLDEQRCSSRDVERRRFGPPGSRAVTVPDADVATTPSCSSAAWSEPVVKSASSTAPYSRSTAASSKAIGTPSARRIRSTRTTSASASNPSASISSGRAGRDPRRDHARAGDLAPPLHLVAERQEHPGPTVHRPAGDERALAPMPIDEPGVRQLLQRLAHGHPADAEAGAQLRLARQRVTGLGPGDQPTQIVLDLSVAGGGRRAR